MNAKQYHEQQLIRQQASPLQNNYYRDVILKINAEENAIMTKNEMPPKIDFLVVSHASGVLHAFLLIYTKGLQSKLLQSVPPVL
jgi:hypothetical protein